VSRAPLCLLGGLVPLAPWALLEPALAQLTGAMATPAATAGPRALLRWLGSMGLLLVAALVLVALVRGAVLRRRAVRESTTWACGYALAVPRAQYTGSSLVEPVAAFLEPLLPSRNLAVRTPRGLFPREAWVKTGSTDIFRQRMYAPVFAWLRDAFSRARRIQHGQLQWYLLYIFATLILLLVLELGVRR
jgi:hypothetical protein